MSLPTRLLSCPLRQYSTTSAPIHTRSNRLGSAAVLGYVCVVVGAPFAGAFVVSRNAREDVRYAAMRPLGFRNCLPGSSLEDYAGALRMRG